MVIVAPSTRQSLQYPRITQIRAKLSHQWWLEQTELERRGRKLLLSAQLETAMQKLHLLLYSWTFLHPVNMQWSPRIHYLPPRCLQYIRCLDTPLRKQFTVLETCHTRETTTDAVFSKLTWCPANTSRKVQEKKKDDPSPSENRELSCSWSGAETPTLA